MFHAFFIKFYQNFTLFYTFFYLFIIISIPIIMLTKVILPNIIISSFSSSPLITEVSSRYTSSKNTIAILISFLMLLSIVKSDKKENGSETSGVSISTESPGMESNNSEASNEQTSVESSDAESNYSFYYGELKITINSKDLNYDTYDDPYNWYLPNDGMKYIMVSFTFENTGKYDEYVSIYDFDCYADNVLCEQAFLPDDSDFINTNLSSGRMISFQTYYQVPVDSVSIELEYGTNSWLNDKEVITIQ